MLRRAIKRFLAKRRVRQAIRMAEAGRTARARAQLETVVKDLSGEWRTACLNQIGMLSYDLGEFPAACAAYQRALESMPDDATILMNLGNALDQMNDAAGAGRAYERALQAQPGHPDVLLN